MRRQEGKSQAYAHTSVEVAVTQHRDISGLFARYGIKRKMFMTDDEAHIAIVRFELRPSRWARVMLRAPVESGASDKQIEQAERTVWRALYYWLKVQFEAIEYGVFSPEEAFLGWLEIPSPGGGIALKDLLLPNLDDLPKLLPDKRDG
jgi:hypothetical protein